MSFEATTWAFEQELPSGAKFLLVALANGADEFGIGFSGREFLAGRCCCSAVSVSSNMKRLEEADLLARVERRRSNGSRTSDWSVLAPNLEDRGAMLDADEDEFPIPVARLARRGSGKDSLGKEDEGGQVKLLGVPPEPSGGTSARGRGARDQMLKDGDRLSLKYRGKPVPEKTARLAVKALDHYVDRSGQSVQRWNPDGSPSEGLKRIIGALVAHPDVEGPQWRETIDAVLAAPWWEGPPSIGVVFGPKVVEQNLLAPSRGRKKGGAGRNGSDPLTEKRLRAARGES